MEGVACGLVDQQEIPDDNHMKGDAMADDELMEDEFEDVEDANDDLEDEIEDETEEEEEEKAIRPSRRSRRSGGRSRRGAGPSRRAEVDPSEKNYVLAFILTLFLGPLGIDRFVLGEPIPGVIKLLGTIIAGAMFFAQEQIGLDPALATGIGYFAAVGMLGTVQFRDLILHFLYTIGWIRPYALLYCSSCKEEQELDTNEVPEYVVCGYEDCNAMAPKPEQNIAPAVREYVHAMVSHSLYAIGLCLSAATCVVLAYRLTWPDLAGTADDAEVVAWPQTPGLEEGLQVLLIGAAVLGMVMIWQVVCAERQKPILTL